MIFVVSHLTVLGLNFLDVGDEVFEWVKSCWPVRNLGVFESTTVAREACGVIFLLRCVGRLCSSQMLRKLSMKGGAQSCATNISLKVNYMG